MKKLIFTFILIAITLTACGRNNTQNEVLTRPQRPTQQFDILTPFEIPQETKDGSHIHGFLSRIEYGENAAYIIGSMHLGRPDWFPLAPMVQEAKSRSDIFAFEVDFGLMDETEVADHMMQFAVLPDNQTLKDFLPDDVFNHFYAMIETFPNITFEMLERFTPAFASYFIALVEAMPLMGVETDYSVDMHIMDFAKDNNKPVIGLNDIFREFDLTFDWPKEVQISALAEFADFETFAEEVSEMGLADAYDAQDAEWIYREAILPLRESAEESVYGQFMFDSILLERCVIFAEEIERLLRETEEPTTFFITIGAAHVLFGYIFDMLQDNGLEVVSLWKDA